MLATTRERRPLSFMATTTQSGAIAANKISEIGCMGMQAVQVFVYYIAGPAPIAGQLPLIEFGVDGVNFPIGYTLTAVTGSGGLAFFQSLPIGAAKFVRVTIFSVGAFAILSNVQLTSFTPSAC